VNLFCYDVETMRERDILTFSCRQDFRTAQLVIARICSRQLLLPPSMIICTVSLLSISSIIFSNCIFVDIGIWIDVKLEIEETR
jgi:hypothetical protein